MLPIRSASTSALYTSINAMIQSSQTAITHFRVDSADSSVVKRSLDTSSLHSILKLVGLGHSDSRRLDGVTSFPFTRGKALAWDATSTDWFSASNMYTTILNCVQRQAWPMTQRDKNAIFEIVPVAVETSKIIHSAGCSLLTDIDCWAAWATDVLSQLSNVFLQISVAIIQGNVLDMMSSLRRYDEI